MDATYFYDTLVGGREDNQDCGLFWPMPFAQPVTVFVVADGMGGLANGAACARRTAAAFCSELLYALYPAALEQPHAVFTPDSLEQAVRDAMTAAADRVYLAGQDSLAAAGSTLTAAVLGEDSLTIGVLGDSPAYLVRGGDCRLLAPLHNLAFEQQLEPGTAGYEQAACCLTQCVGTRPASCLTPAVRTYPCGAVAGGVLLLGSDGAFGSLTAPQIADVVSAMRGAPGEIVPVLLAAARESGSTDNQTLFAVCL